MPKRSRAARRAELIEEIEKFYKKRDPWTIPGRATKIQDHTMDMFSVATIEKNIVEFQSLSDDRVYRAAILEEPVLKRVGRGDVFLMAMVQINERWIVWYMSPPYS